MQKLTKDEFIKKMRIDQKLFSDFVNADIIEEKELYTEEDVEKVKKFKKINVFKKEDLFKRYKIKNTEYDLLLKENIMENKPFYNNKDVEILKSYKKLKSLGYDIQKVIKILKEIGLPEEDNLFDNDEYIYINDLAKKLNISERTIKFYEKEKLIYEPKIYKNKRFYLKDVEKHLILIKNLQEIGYKLKEIKTIFDGLIYKKDNERRKYDLIKELLKQLEIKKGILNKTIDMLERMNNE